MASYHDITSCLRHYGLNLWGNPIVVAETDDVVLEVKNMGSEGYLITSIKFPSNDLAKPGRIFARPDEDEDDPVFAHLLAGVNRRHVEEELQVRKDEAA